MRKPPLLCLILLISFPSVSCVLISPALPAMSDFFHISNGYAQQLITLFVIGYAVGNLLYSPLANRFGRKPAIFSGLSLYLFSTLLCIWAIYQHWFHVLLYGRIFMALGASAGMAITFTMINDVYKPDEARSVTSYTVLSYAFMPAVAIFVGGLITTHLSWIDCFYAYLLYGIFMFFIAYLLPETAPELNADALHLRPLFKSYGKTLSNVRLLLYSAIYGLMSAYIYIIASGAPFIGIDHIGLSASQYGLFLLIPYCGQFIGAILSGKVSKRYSAHWVLGIGYGFVITGSVLMFLAFLVDWVTVFSLMIPIFVIMLGLPMTYSSATVMAIGKYHDKATGASMMSFLTMAITLLATLIYTLLPVKHVVVMPSCFIGIFVIACIALLFGILRHYD